MKWNVSDIKHQVAVILQILLKLLELPQPHCLSIYYICTRKKKSTGQRHPNTSDKKKLPYKVFIHENENNHWCIVCQKGPNQIKFETTSKQDFDHQNFPTPVKLIKKNGEDFFEI